MDRLYTIPSQEQLSRAVHSTPEFMRPNATPNAVVLAGALKRDICVEIANELDKVEPYRFPHCDAITREVTREHMSLLAPMVNIAESINERYFGYDLDPDPFAWMQTYLAGNHYQIHTDTTPGQTRKLTAVLLLSDRLDYSGGGLWLHTPPKSHIVDNGQGTIVVFQPWTHHNVDPVGHGVRRTINLGFFGPPFK